MSFSVYIRKAVENGKTIFPTKFCQHCSNHINREKLKCLECLRRSKTAHSFSSQYMNDPIDAESIEFKTNWIQKFEFTKEIAEKLNTVGAIMSIDPAVATSSINDYTGIGISKILPGNQIYILEAQQKRLTPPQLIDEVFKLRKQYNVTKILLETTAAQLVFVSAFKQEMVKRKEFFTIEEVGRSTKETKAMRIRGLIPFYANGLVYHRTGLQDLEYQLIQFPRNTHDDIIDALAHQITYWKSGKVSNKPRDNAPYMSLNWWKKQTGNGNRHSERVQKLFGDLL